MKKINLFSGNETLEKYLVNSFASGKFPNSILFLHEKHTNVHKIILQTIKKILLTFDKKYSKLNFNSFEEFKYSELVKVIPKNGTIIKDDVIKAISKISHTSINKNSPKILFIENIDFGNLNSLNALLKFLEELTDNTFTIMNAYNINNVLPTIKSRVQVLRVNRQNREVFEFLLNEIFLDKSIKNYALKTLDTVEAAINLNKKINVNLILEITNIFNQAFEDSHLIRFTLLSLLNKSNVYLSLDVIREYFTEVWLETTKDKKVLNISEKASKFYIQSSIKFFPIIEILDKYKNNFRKIFNFELQKNAFILEIAKIYEN